MSVNEVPANVAPVSPVNQGTLVKVERGGWRPRRGGYRVKRVADRGPTRDQSRTQKPFPFKGDMDSMNDHILWCYREIADTK